MNRQLDTPVAPQGPALPLYPEPRVLQRAEHPISRREIPESVLKVLYRLQRSGYRAYLCGGSVRDLMMERKPKDFDLATDAHPNDIRRLFRNSRIVGRRFRIVHILFQEGFVEVATFRREPEGRADEEEDLLVTDDNVFGNPAQDARRRDFTVNGLFYDIVDFSVIDHVGGIDDLNSRLIRVIGTPAVRFREDPVRMMRAVEFASRLGFEIEPTTYQAITLHRGEILKAAPPRVAEEVLELLRRGWSEAAFRMMVETRLLEPLLPELDRILRSERTDYFWKMLEVLDRTVASGRKVTDSVLFAVLLLPYVLEEIARDEKKRGARLRVSETLLLLRETIQPVCQRFLLSAGMRHQIEQAFEMLWRLLEPPVDRKATWRFVFREHFDDALALLELYALSSGTHVENFRHWQSFAHRARRREDATAPSHHRAAPGWRRSRGK